MVSGSEIAKKIINPEYETPKLKKILADKRKQEKLLNKLRKSVITSQIAYSVGGLLFKTHLFDKKIIRDFS